MAISKYISIITLTINRTNAPIKRQRAAEWCKNKTHYMATIYVTYKRLTSYPKTHTDRK